MTREAVKNIFADIPDQLPQELTETLLSAKNLRIERIISEGHQSEPSFWYDQYQHEWVLVIQGKPACNLKAQ